MLVSTKINHCDNEWLAHKVGALSLRLREHSGRPRTVELPDGSCRTFPLYLCEWQTERGKFYGVIPVILNIRQIRPPFLAALFGSKPSYSADYDDFAMFLELRFMVAMSGGRMLTDEEVHQLHEQTTRIEGRPADERILLTRSVRALQAGCYFSNGQIVNLD